MRKIYESLISITEKKFRVDARYFINGGFWLSLGQVTTIVFGLLTTVLLTRYLPETSYGIYKYLIALVAIFSAFSLSGVGQSILQTAAKGYGNFYRENISLIFKFNLLISLSALSGSVYYWYNDNTLLSIGCLLIALIQPITQTFQSIPAYLNGKGNFKLSTKIHLARMSFISATTLITLFLTQSVLWLFLAYISSHLVVNLVTYYLFIKPASKTPTHITQKYLNYAKHTSLRNLIEGIASKADAIIIFTSLGAVELALYSVATVIPEQIKSSLKNVATLLMPKYAKIDDPDILIKTLPKRSFQLLVILVLITIAYILIAPLVIPFLFPKYPEAVLYTQIAAISFPTFIALLPHSILKAKLANSELYKINTINSILQIILVFLGATFYGLMGVVVATIIRRVFNLLVAYYFTFKKMST
jgi:O-antigen/teichoic acid export membrane protein